MLVEREKKLMGVERSIQVFENQTHALTAEFPIDISLSQLKEIVSPTEDDPLLYGFHKLTNRQIVLLLPFIKEHSITLDSGSFYYVLACFGLYEK